MQLEQNEKRRKADEILFLVHLQFNVAINRTVPRTLGVKLFRTELASVP